MLNQSISYEELTGSPVWCLYINHCCCIAGALAWNADLLASGSRDRMIMLHDTRVVPVVPEKRLAGHRQEVCQCLVE